MAQSGTFMSSQRCCIVCGEKIPNINFGIGDVKFKCPNCGIKFHRQQCGRRSESIRVYFGGNML